MGNTQVKSDITPEQYAEYMKLKQQAEYQKQLAISKENNYRQPIQFRPPVQPPNVSTPKLQANYQQPNIIPDTRPVSQYNENEKRSNIDINVRNSMNNMGINYRMVDSLKNPIGENTLEDKAFKNNDLFNRYTNNIGNYHHIERIDSENSVMSNPKDDKDQFMDKVDSMLNDRMFERGGSENTEYYPRMEPPKLNEKMDQTNMEKTYQELCSKRGEADPILEKSKNNQETINTQTNRRDDYLKKIKEVKDPFKLLGLTRSDTLATAKNSYKKLALKLHPDRGGDPKAFSLLTKAFLSVTEELKAREQHNHNDMKKDQEQYTKKNFSGEGGNKKINIAMFNDIYEKNKLFDPYDNGYNDWINKNPLTDEDPKELFSNGFNADVFNKVFEEKNDDQDDYDDKQVAKYGGPSAQLDTSISYTELGVDKVNDFSKISSNDNNDLNYTDYRKAHSKSRLIDVTKHGRQEYKNINDLESERERITYDLHGEDALRLEKVAELREKEEYDRLMKQREQDRAIGNQFETVNRQYLGH